jgi:hypothetical protein
MAGHGATLQAASSTPPLQLFVVLYVTEHPARRATASRTSTARPISEPIIVIVPFIFPEALGPRGEKPAEEGDDCRHLRELDPELRVRH